MLPLRTSSFFVRTISQDLQRLSRAQKFKLVSIFWQQAGLKIEEFHEDSYAVFLKFIGDELNELRHHQACFATDSFESIGEWIQLLKDNRTSPLSDLVSYYKSRFINVDENAIKRSIELTVRLWLTVNVNSAAIAVGPILAHTGTLEWGTDQSLNDLIAERFGMIAREKSGLSHATSRVLPTVDANFTAANLVSICGVKLNWTDNLADHLNYDRSRHVLTVYKHKICLINHMKASTGCPIPVSVLEEAIDTINLLFPFGDKATKRLLVQEGQAAFYGLGNCGRDRQEDFKQYNRWQKQLVELDDVFNEPPQTWRQLVVDRRKLVDWAAFWITVMVLVLTLVSIPCSIIQTVYTVKSYNLAVRQQSSSSPQGLKI